MTRPAEALPEVPVPTVTLHRVVQTAPFKNAHTSMRDNEGSAYVARDHALWLADDDGERLYEVGARTGRLRRTIRSDQLQATKRFHGGRRAGSRRVGDLEAMAYDRRHDRLYVFSGSSEGKPAVFRLSRNKRGRLAPDSYQPLPVGSDFTAAGWHPRERTLYVGADRTLWSYAYGRNEVSAPFLVPGLAGLLGMTFTRDGTSLLVARTPALLSRIDWATRSLVPTWTVDLAPSGIIDVRAVELVRGRLWVSDGYDYRARGDGLSHALFVYDIS